jgi:hypothetical protein
MSKNTNPLKKILAPARRFTLESFKNTFENKKTTLPALLHKFPNYGLGFKITKFKNENEYWIIDQVKPKSNKHADFFALKYNIDGTTSNAIERLRNVYKEDLYEYEIPEKCNYITSNGVEYDISKYEKLRNEKIEMRKKRFDILEELKPERARLLEYKKIKKESLTKKKK